jgi:hypothetical protein
VHGYIRGHDEVKIVQGTIEEGRMTASYRKGERLTGGSGGRVRQGLMAMADPR